MEPPLPSHIESNVYDLLNMHHKFYFFIIRVYILLKLPDYLYFSKMSNLIKCSSIMNITFINLLHVELIDIIQLIYVFPV